MNTTGIVTEIDVRFTIEIKLQGVVARSNDDGRRLSTDDGFDGSARNLTKLLFRHSLGCG